MILRLIIILFVFRLCRETVGMKSSLPSDAEVPIDGSSKPVPDSPWSHSDANSTVFQSIMDIIIKNVPLSPEADMTSLKGELMRVLSTNHTALSSTSETEEMKELQAQLSAMNESLQLQLIAKEELVRKMEGLEIKAKLARSEASVNKLLYEQSTLKLEYATYQHEETLAALEKEWKRKSVARSVESKEGGGECAGVCTWQDCLKGWVGGEHTVDSFYSSSASSQSSSNTGHPLSLQGEEEDDEDAEAGLPPTLPMLLLGEVERAAQWMRTKLPSLSSVYITVLSVLVTPSNLSIPDFLSFNHSISPSSSDSLSAPSPDEDPSLSPSSNSVSEYFAVSMDLVMEGFHYVVYYLWRGGDDLLDLLPPIEEQTRSYLISILYLLLLLLLVSARKMLLGLVMGLLTLLLLPVLLVGYTGAKVFAYVFRTKKKKTKQSSKIERN